MTREKQAQQRDRKTVKWVSIGVLVVMVVGGGVLLWNFGYKSGVEAGVSEQREKMDDSLSTLGRTVAEKTEFLTKLSDLNSEVPEEVDEESAKEFIEKLSSVAAECSNEEAKVALETYKAAWEKFIEVYQSEDNSAISEELSNLRSAASDAGIAVTEAYNKAINEAAEKLPE